MENAHPTQIFWGNKMRKRLGGDERKWAKEEKEKKRQENRLVDVIVLVKLCRGDTMLYQHPQIVHFVVKQ